MKRLGRVGNLSLSNDLLQLRKIFLESRLQGKYTKFLQFLVDFPELKSYEYITHIDHKNVISYEEIKRIKSLFLPEKKKFL